MSATSTHSSHSGLNKHPLQEFVEEASCLIRARYPLIGLNSHEENRVLDVIKELSDKRKSKLFIWSRTEGTYSNDQPINDNTDPLSILKWYEQISEKSLLVLKDYHPFLKDPTIVRKLRDLSHYLKHSQKTVILLSPHLPIPLELSKEIALLNVPLPGTTEIETLVKKASGILSDNSKPTELDTQELLLAAQGLTYDEIENVFAKSIVSNGKLDKRIVQDEKKQIVKKSGLLEFIDTDHSSQVGGLKNLQQWLNVRRKGFSKQASELGLPMPKGILLVGVPGCGKSLTATTIGKQWELPLLRLDIGKLFSGLVGSSENNARQMIQTCEAVAPCVLWIDEIEKGLSGTQSSGSSDGGTTSRVFGTFLTWMQEKKSPVFVLATANDISQLPPEFLRKGRFDEIFFVDLPTTQERHDILEIHFQRFNWKISDLNISELVECTEGFSGSELEQAIIGARYLAFGNEETFSQAHIIHAIQETVPLSKTMTDRIEHLRSWAKNRARPASDCSLVYSKKDRFNQRTNSLELDNHKQGETC